MKYWRYLSPAARASLVRRVAIVGPASSGKTTLSLFLGERFQTSVVPELAVQYSKPLWGVLKASDYRAIAIAQANLEEALAPQAERLLICDTNLDQLFCWQKLLLGDSTPLTNAPARHYDRVFLLKATSDSGQFFKETLIAQGVTPIETDSRSKIIQILKELREVHDPKELQIRLSGQPLSRI